MIGCTCSLQVKPVSGLVSGRRKCSTRDIQKPSQSTTVLESEASYQNTLPNSAVPVMVGAQLVKSRVSKETVSQLFLYSPTQRKNGHSNTSPRGYGSETLLHTQGKQPRVALTEDIEPGDNQRLDNTHERPNDAVIMRVPGSDKSYYRYMGF